MASPFAKYQSEQVQQIAPGFVEAFGRAGASIGQGIASAASSIGKGMEAAEQRQIELAKQAGALKPYLNSEVANVTRSIENGFLQVGKDGKVSITPGQEGNLDANKVGRAIDLYNQTDGGKKELKAADLAGVIGTIQSYDTLEKQASDRVAAAGAARKAQVELDNSILEGKVKKFTLTKGASDALLTQAKQAQEEADFLSGDPSVPRDVIQQRYAMAAGIKDQALNIVRDSFADVGINIAAYNPQPPARPPVTPGAVPMGLDVSSLQTVPTPVPSFGAAPAGMDFSAFDARLRAGSAPAPVSAPTPAATQATPTPMAPAAKPVAQPAPAPAVQPAAPVAQAPAAPAAPVQPVSPQNLLTNKMAKQAVTPPAGQPPAAVTPVAPTVGLQSKTANEIIARQSEERQNYLNANTALQSTLRGVPGLPPSSRENLLKNIEANKSKITAIDKLLNDQTAIIAEQSKAESQAVSAKATSTSEQRQLVGAFEKAYPMAGGGWIFEPRANAMEALNRGEIKSLEEAALTTKFGPQFQGSFDDVKDTLSSLDGFMKAAIATDRAIDKRLASGDKYLDRLAFTSKDFTTLAEGNIAEKLLLANMRKIIVSGGNFSDQDRKFILEAIASINTLDATKGAKYFKKLNSVMAQMGYSMYADKLAVARFVNRPDLTGDDKSPMSRVRQDFETRFGTGEARAELEALVAAQLKTAKPSDISSLRSAIEEFATAPAPEKK
jgi:hypothetical protein